MVEEVFTSRVNHVKSLVEKEFSDLNKLAIDHIKIKKKKLSTSDSYTKEETQRLTREIEKESVDFAVRENSKMGEILTSKKNKIKSSLQSVYKEINEAKKDVNSLNLLSLQIKRNTFKFMFSIWIRMWINMKLATELIWPI